MIYQCKQELYNSIANSVKRRDLEITKLSLHGFILWYINDWLNLPEGTITQIRTY